MMCEHTVKHLQCGVEKVCEGLMMTQNIKVVHPKWKFYYNVLTLRPSKM